MATNATSNYTTGKVMPIFLKAFENERVLTKAVNRRIITGAEFQNAEYGTEIAVKRPHDYRSIETSGGDLSLSTLNSIIAGQAKMKVQNMITVPIPWDNIDETLKLNQLEEILRPAAKRAVTTLETNFAKFMMTNCHNAIGTVGSPVTKWEHVAEAYAYMEALGVPTTQGLNYVINPYQQAKLAGAQSSIYADDLVKSAWQKAQIPSQFAGVRAMTATTLATFQTNAGADRAGTLSATPNATYATHKDTMIQDLAVTGFQANLDVSAGEVIEVTGRYHLNQSTRLPMMNGTQAQVIWRGVVTEAVTLNGSGAGTLKVAGPAINEANGQYNTVVSALQSGDVITLLGNASTLYQPNMIFHEEAFGLGTIRLKKLAGWDNTIAEYDGISMRLVRYSDPLKNTQGYRLDLLPAFAVYNPFFAGQAYGQP